MGDIGRAEQSRLDITTFRIIADALLLRGYHRLNGKIGQQLERALRSLSPEIYGTMNDPRVVELGGLRYILDRLPRGIEACRRIVLFAREDLEGSSFEKIVSAKRRRTCYRVSRDEIGISVTRGMTEIYDILTHITFLYIEAKKIHANMTDAGGHYTKEWKTIEAAFRDEANMGDADLDQVIWNMSILLGCPYNEVKETYEHLEKSRTEQNASNGLLHIIYNLGKGIEKLDRENGALEVYFTPPLSHTILHQIYGKKWAAAVTDCLKDMALSARPLHIISANMHSVVNVLYGFGAVKKETGVLFDGDLYSLIRHLRDKEIGVAEYAGEHGFHHMTDTSGANIDFQIIDTAGLEAVEFHPSLGYDLTCLQKDKPVLLVMDYAFGSQAFELMDELLQPQKEDGKKLDVHSISVMGKAGTLTGSKGDIMLATAHVLEGVPHNYIVKNDLDRTDFDLEADVYEGPIVTVLGTSLQNRHVLEKFLKSNWKAVGLEMEGGHYQRAINAAIIRGNISDDVKVRYAYYASDNPLMSDMTLASGSLGDEGVAPTYAITKAILDKILKRTGPAHH